ncbi:hypothetical protein VF14_35420 [Nostoc linckia z18]|uniref:hypothetical protein n=1 Tax=Nostoc linckia TaxID=92942 RepID=UPI000BFFBB98|nr:hypothetical protein [Nostoc linckia]PHK28015.1 hypothetical protein VF14_35420 [Nostoc linckia z18]
MFVFVEITAEPVIQGNPIQDKQTGYMKPGIARQNAYMHQGLAYPLPFKVKVPESGPYRPGRYLITGEVFKTGQYGLDYRGADLALTSFEDAAKLIAQKPASVAAAA